MIKFDTIDDEVIDVVFLQITTGYYITFLWLTTPVLYLVFIVPVKYKGVWFNSKKKEKFVDIRGGSGSLFRCLQFFIML